MSSTVTAAADLGAAPAPLALAQVECYTRRTAASRTRRGAEVRQPASRSFIPTPSVASTDSPRSCSVYPLLDQARPTAAGVLIYWPDGPSSASWRLQCAAPIILVVDNFGNRRSEIAAINNAIGGLREISHY
jgi:hypothetical protein